MTNTKNTTQTYKNKHDRKQTRGIRPWLLIPKIIAVACLLGGLMSLLVIGLTISPVNNTVINIYEIIFTRIVIPASTITIILGIALLTLHGTVLLRMRWVIVKIIIVFTALPGVHLTTRFLFLKLKSRFGNHELTNSLPVDQLVTQLNISLAISICIVIALIWLGRHKPRLNQKVGPPKKNEK